MRNTTEPPPGAGARAPGPFDDCVLECAGLSARIAHLPTLKAIAEAGIKIPGHDPEIEPQSWREALSCETEPTLTWDRGAWQQVATELLDADPSWRDEVALDANVTADLPPPAACPHTGAGETRDPFDCETCHEEYTDACAALEAEMERDLHDAEHERRQHRLCALNEYVSWAFVPIREAAWDALVHTAADTAPAGNATPDTPPCQHTP